MCVVSSYIRCGGGGGGGTSLTVQYSSASVQTAELSNMMKNIY